MLALLGLFGVMMAGLAADALVTHRSEGAEDAEDDADLPPEAEDDLADRGDLLDEIGNDPTIPTSDDRPQALEEAVTLSGGQEADILSGYGANDEICGDDGADLIDGRAGDDWIEAGDGNDQVWGADGADSILGQAGNDTIQGHAGDDLIDG
ncbi:MAG: calcium-binding protein, partial [Albidovulum sp.]